MKHVLIWCVAAPIAIMMILSFIGAANDTSTLPDRIERECKAEYGSRGEQEVLNCRLALSVHAIREGEAKKINRAYDRAR